MGWGRKEEGCGGRDVDIEAASLRVEDKKRVMRSPDADIFRLGTRRRLRADFFCDSHVDKHANWSVKLYNRLQASSLRVKLSAAFLCVEMKRRRRKVEVNLIRLIESLGLELLAI